MSDLVKEILRYINDFREDPTSVTKEIEYFQIILQRLKPNDPFLSEINSILNLLPTLKKLQKLTFNICLTKFAEIELKKFIKDPGSFPLTRKEKECYGFISDSYMSENPGIIYDNGAESANYVCPRILLSKLDKTKTGRLFLLNPDYSQIGLAAEIVDDEIFTVIILANNYTEDIEIDEQQLSELKKAFDLFDYHSEGRIRIDEALESMKDLKMDETDPVLYQIMQELQSVKLVSWPKFAQTFTKKLTDRGTDEGLKDMFNLFIDNVQRNTINLEVLQRICKVLGINKTENELTKILYESSNSSSQIDFEGFCKMMKIG